MANAHHVSITQNQTSFMHIKLPDLLLGYLIWLLSRAIMILMSACRFVSAALMALSRCRPLTLINSRNAADIFKSSLLQRRRHLYDVEMTTYDWASPWTAEHRDRQHAVIVIPRCKRCDIPFCVDIPKFAAASPSIRHLAFAAAHALLMGSHQTARSGSLTCGCPRRQGRLQRLRQRLQRFRYWRLYRRHERQRRRQLRCQLRRQYPFIWHW